MKHIDLAHDDRVHVSLSQLASNLVDRIEYIIYFLLVSMKQDYELLFKVSSVQKIVVEGPSIKDPYPVFIEGRSDAFL